ncbi:MULTISPECIES: class I SAM-dependent methyltransferase [unclassified Nocardioides]|uniref:class I SAM-dependent methyltransferase n=1 Tax=unclassified Nocardioides TaxID=2615069 RepID=UPI0000570D9E|nr:MULTISPECIES: class I SAM-dependent methyltransferase [unclassified Nocardioides]ABL81717.1 Methyltransferase type 11 [Nocardioides sp. JS614]
MLMNRTETLMVDNPARRALQRWYEAPTLRRLGGPLPAGSRVLEIGCGPGYGTSLIIDYFGAGHVDAVDLDPRMIGKARRRLRHHSDRVRLAVGDATDLHAALGVGEEAYDAAFDFAIVHHIEDWRAALAEITRVLRPGGVFYFEEVTAHALARPSYRALFDHPERDRFTAEEFLYELPRHGLRPLGTVIRIRGDYLPGDARRS